MDLKIPLKKITDLFSLKDFQDDFNTIKDKFTNIDTSLESISFDYTSNNVDDTQYIQNYINNNDTVVFKPNRYYKIKNTIKIPSNKHIDFNNCTFEPVTGGTFINDFMFLINSNDGIDWVDRFGGYTNSVKNIKIDNSKWVLPNIKGFFVGAVSELHNIKTISLYQTIRIADRFLDGMKIDRVFIINHKSDTNYAISQDNDKTVSVKNANGDSWHISNLQIEGTGTRKLLYLAGENDTCVVDGVINGQILLKNGWFDLRNIHLEIGNITIKNAKVKISNSMLYFDTGNGTPILITTENYLYKDVELNNVFFTYPFWQDTNPLTKGGYNYPIKVDDAYRGNITLKDVKQGIQNLNCNQGIGIITVGGTDVAKLEPNVMCHNSVINLKNTIAPLTYCSKMPTNNSNFAYCDYKEIKTVWSSTSDTERGILFKGNSSTYYYKVGIFYDYNRRIGMYDSREFTVVVDNAERKLPTFSLLDNFLDKILNTNLIIYRGTTSGTYVDRTIIPMVDNSSQHFDDYKSMCLRPWVTHSGAIWAFNTYERVIKDTSTGNVTCYGTSTPTIGTWVNGDRIVNTNLSVGQIKSWVYNGTAWISEGTY